MALRGIKVLEIAGLAPAPFCGMVLSDFGASVIRIDKTGPLPDIDCLSNGKESVAINLKNPEGMDVFKRLCRSADVLVEPFRKGIMEKLGLGPTVLMDENPRLVYARLTGFGQKGMYSERAGHDINFLAISGVLSMLGGESPCPTPPVNLAADFGGGGLTCAFGIVMALLERTRSGLGQVVDCSMVCGTAYLASWLVRSQPLPLLWGNARGRNVLDGGAHFYTTYETADGKWMAVGAIEPQFYEQLVQGLGLPDVPQFPDDYGRCKLMFADKFKEKTRDDWCQIFDTLDACVCPVLTPGEAAVHPHNAANRTHRGGAPTPVPAPAPSLSRTPPNNDSGLRPRPRPGQHTRPALLAAGITAEEIARLTRLGAIMCADSKL